MNTLLLLISWGYNHIVPRTSWYIPFRLPVPWLLMCSHSAVPPSSPVAKWKRSHLRRQPFILQPCLLLPPIWVLIPTVLHLFGQLSLQSIDRLKEARAAPPSLHITFLPLNLVGVEEQACTPRLSHQQQAAGGSWGAASCRSCAPPPAVAAARLQARF